jgi:hypothetical protein
MRTKLAVSIAAASALLATVAVPMAVEDRAAVRPEATSTVEHQLLAQGVNGTRRPLVARAEELNDRESA